MVAVDYKCAIYQLRGVLSYTGPDCILFTTVNSLLKVGLCIIFMGTNTGVYPGEIVRNTSKKKVNNYILHY